MPNGQSAKFNPPLDEGIERAVQILVSAGVETYESCEGGEGHSFPRPTICFHGDRSEGFRALAAAFQNGLGVSELRRVWAVLEGEPTGPEWQLVFWRKEPCRED